MHSQLFSCCTAKASGTGLSGAIPTKVEALKSFLFSEKLPCIENKEHLVDFVTTKML